MLSYLPLPEESIDVISESILSIPRPSISISGSISAAKLRILGSLRSIWYPIRAILTGIWTSSRRRMLRSFDAGYSYSIPRCRWPSLRMSRSYNRLIVVCILAVAFFSMWELYYHVSVRSNEYQNNPDKPNQVRNFGSRQKTMDEMEQSKASHLDFMKEQAEVQRGRKRLIEDACANVPPEDEISAYTKRHIYVVDKHKIAYCFVPKVGCSNWKRILMVLNGDVDTVEGLSSNEVHMHAKMKFLYEYDDDMQQQIMKNYHWFFLVREPFKRALSVYRNKFESYEYYKGNRFFQRFGKEIIKKWRKNPTKEAIETGANATWPEFVDYLTHPEERAKVEGDWHFSDHWREMWKICAPCTVNYDFIGNLESVNNDAKYIVKLWGVEGKVSYLSSDTSRPTNSSSSSTYDKYFGMLSKEQLTGLWDLYKLDYALFNYTKPEVVP